MKWKTAISNDRDGEHYVRGEKLGDLIENATFTEAIFLTLQGKKPSDAERAMLDAILVSCIDHGIAVPTAFVPRVVASTGNSMNASLAAGVLAVSDYHGGAIEGVMKMLATAEVPERVPGLGHKIYKDADPRAWALFKKAADLGIASAEISKIQEIEKSFAEKKNKKLPINVDGAAGAILSGMGFDWRIGKAIFILGRLPSMIANTLEEMQNEKPFRKLDDEDIEYIG